MRYRTQLQSYIEVSADTTQETRFAVEVGQAKTAVACINIIKNNCTATITFDFETATDPGSSSWASAGSVGVSAQTTGLKRAELGGSSTTGLASVVRWKLTGVSGSPTIGFDIVIFFADT